MEVIGFGMDQNRRQSNMLSIRSTGTSSSSSSSSSGISCLIDSSTRSRASTKTSRGGNSTNSSR